MKEEEQRKRSARVITPSGIPDSGVSVYLIDAGNWVEKRRLDLPVVIDSAITNRDGFFTLKYDSGTVCNLQADGRDGAAFIPGFKADYDSILVIRLKQKATLNGRIDSSGLRISRAEIFGTLYSISVQGQDFTVPGIAPEIIRFFSGHKTISMPDTALLQLMRARLSRSVSVSAQKQFWLMISKVHLNSTGFPGWGK